MLTLFLALSFLAQTNDMSQIEALISDDPAAAEKALLKAMDQSENDAKAAILLCRLYTNQNNYEKALPIGKKAVKLAPNDPQANYYYAVAIRQKMSKSTMFAMSNTGKYKKLLDQAIELDPEYLDAYHEKFGFLMNAPPIAGGSVEKAETLANKVKGLNQERGLTLLYEVYQKQEASDKQYETAKSLTQLNPKKMRYQYFYGFSLQASKKYEDAADFFGNLFDNNPTELGALYQEARSRILGNFDSKKAIEALDQYIELADEKTQPSQAAAHWRAGMAFEQLGDKDAAKKRYKEALKLDPKMKEAKKALKNLK